MLSCKFKLTDEQVTYFIENYPVHFEDDFRGNIEQFIQKELGRDINYEIEKYYGEHKFTVYINSYSPNDVIEIAKLNNITSNLELNITNNIVKF